MQTTRSGRNGGIDWLRFFGAIGIVWFHMGLPGSWISYAALPVFIILLVHFGHDRSLGERAVRLLVPWLLWSLVFAGLKLLDATAGGSDLATEFQPWMLLTGPSLHLWFLPFAFAFLALARIFARTALVLALPLSLAAIWLTNGNVLPIPLAQWANILPAAFLGLWLARVGDPAPVCGVALIGGLVLLWFGYAATTVQLVIAAAVVWATLALPLRASELSRLAADLALGLYLIHPIMIALGLRLFPDMGEGRLFALVIAGALVATWVLRRIAPQMVGHRTPLRT